MYPFWHAHRGAHVSRYGRRLHADPGRGEPEWFREGAGAVNPRRCRQGGDLPFSANSLWQKSFVGSLGRTKLPKMADFCGVITMPRSLRCPVRSSTGRHEARGFRIAPLGYAIWAGSAVTTWVSSRNAEPAISRSRPCAKSSVQDSRRSWALLSLNASRPPKRWRSPSAFRMEGFAGLVFHPGCLHSGWPVHALRSPREQSRTGRPAIGAGLRCRIAPFSSSRLVVLSLFFVLSWPCYAPVASKRYYVQPNWIECGPFTESARPPVPIPPAGSSGPGPSRS